MLLTGLRDKGAVLAIYFLIFTNPISAQVYLFEQIGLEDGLPNNRINDMIEDSRGFIWLATDGGGLIRFDGYEFKTFSQNAENSDLLAYSLKEDGEGNIWIGLEKALLKFNGKTFKRINLPSNFKLKKMSVFDDGRLIISTQNGDLFQFKKEWKSLNYSNSEVFDFDVFQNKIAFSNAEGLFVSSEISSQLIDTLSVKKVRFIKDEIFALGDNDLIVYSGKGELKRKVKAKFQDLFRNGKEFVGLDSERNLLVGNGSYFRRIGLENGLPELEYRGVYQDSYGVIWLYGNKGLVKLESLAVQVFEDFNGTTNNQINSVHIGEEGKVYAGFSQGILSIDSLGSKLSNSQNGYPYGLTLAIEEYDEALWFGTEAGLIKKVGGDFEKIALPGSPFGAYIFSMKSALSKLWISSGSDLFSYSESGFKNITKTAGLPPASIYSISKGQADNSLWCATYTQGFFRLFDGKWDLLKSLHGIQLDSLRFSCFVAVSKDEIWAASLTEGLFHLSKKGFEKISLKDLAYAEISSLELDENGNVWAGSNKGVLKINSEKQVINLSELMGFKGRPNAVQAITLKENKLVAATSGGIQFLDLKRYLEPRKDPKIAIIGVKMFLSDSNYFSEYAQDSLPYSLVPSNLILPHNLNFLSFNLAGLSAFEQNKLQYRYRLNGESNNWTFANDRREAVYSNIKPGSYVFEAQVKRLDEEWNGDSLKYSFKILTPVWERWWFIVLAIVLVLSATILLVKTRFQRKQKRLELENSLLDMERKALRLQMNPHFIFNALDSISSFIFKKDPEKAVRYLNNFAKLMRLTLESSMEHLHPVETEVSILKNYLELEKLRFQGKFDYSIDLDEEIDYDIGIPPMLIQPHVENAILHGLKPMKSEGELDLRFILDDDEDLLIIEIEDNGVGRKRAKELNRKKDHRSMATQINKDRLKLLKMNKNDKIDIEIIDKLDENENSLGTKVVIKLPAENI